MLNPQPREADLDARMGEAIKLSLVVPVFNESDTVTLFTDRVKAVFGSRDDIEVEIIFVNDGSADDTLAQLLCRVKIPKSASST